MKLLLYTLYKGIKGSQVWAHYYGSLEELRPELTKRDIVIHSETEIGDGTAIENNVWIGSHNTIGNGVIFREGSIVGDYVIIGEMTRIGKNAIVEDLTVIGRCCDIGENRIVKTKWIVPPNTNLLGNPAAKNKKRGK